MLLEHLEELEVAIELIMQDHGLNKGAVWIGFYRYIAQFAD